MTQATYSDEDIIRLHESGLTAPAIARKLKIHAATVRKRKHHLNLPASTRQHSPSSNISVGEKQKKKKELSEEEKLREYNIGLIKGCWERVKKRKIEEMRKKEAKLKAEMIAEMKRESTREDEDDE